MSLSRSEFEKSWISVPEKANFPAPIRIRRYVTVHARIGVPTHCGREVLLVPAINGIVIERLDIYEPNCAGL